MTPQQHWKRAYRSMYYPQAPEPADPVLERGKVALLVIDVQNVYLQRPDPATLDSAARAIYDAWTPFHERMDATVLPTIARLLARFRGAGHEVLFARIACQTRDGRERSLSQTPTRMEQPAVTEGRMAIADRLFNRPAGR